MRLYSYKIDHTVLAGTVTVATEIFVGVGMAKQEQAEVIAEPTNLDRQVGRAIGVGPEGGGGGAFWGGGGGGGGAGGGGPGGGGGALLAIRAGLVAVGI